MIADPEVRPSDGRRTWFDSLPALALLLCVLLSLPILIQVFAPIVILLVLLVAIPIFLFPALGGLTLGFLGALGIGRRKASPAIQWLYFRVELADGSRRDLVLVGHQMGIALGDEVSVRALRGRGVLQALVVKNVTTGATLVRKRLAAVVVALCVLALLFLSLLAAGLQS